MNKQEFEEIGHTGGQVTFNVVTSHDGRRGLQVGFQHMRPTAASLFAVYAIPQGIAVAPLPMGGIGSPWPEPPIPDCFPVFIASDSEGMFGQQCPACKGYWRARFSSLICPYCGSRAQAHHFLTDAQQRYVKQYCDMLSDALASGRDGAYTIDMDAVADAVGTAGEKPPFYYAEERQQSTIECNDCGAVTNILGAFGYCGMCGTRNDLQEIEKRISKLRERINSGGPYEDCCRDLVAALDSFAGQYAKQLIQNAPMTSARRSRIERMHFHKLELVSTAYREVFGIDVLAGLGEQEISFAKLMFHRRHVYEHNGGEADEKYIRDSGDSVRPKQRLHESQESAHRLASLIQKIATNIHKGFHEILPPEAAPIEMHAQQRARVGQARRR